jgi:hypothetical protein
MMGAITIFEKIILNLILWIIELLTKSLGVGCTFEEMAEKPNCQMMKVKFLQSN